MNEDTLRTLLDSLARGEIGVDDVVTRLRALPFEDLGFAKVDHHRAIRCGFPEVIYCEGKTIEQVVTIVDKLDTFRGQSKFTTWAYSIVINVAAGELRHRRWSALSLEALPEEEEPPLMSMIEDVRAQDPERATQQEEVLVIIQRIIDEELTDRQRVALTNLLFRGMPMGEVAERLGTNKNNVYKIMHDARKKLKKRLPEYDLSEDYVLSIFS